MASITFENFYSHDTDVYNMEGFEPQIVDKAYLDNLGVTTSASEATLEGLRRGSEIFMERMKSRTVIPVSKLEIVDIKLIASAQEASVTTTCSDEEKLLLEKTLGDSLSQWLIVSAASVQTGETGASVVKASGTKCPRCWNYSETPDENGLCPRCHEVMAKQITR